MERIMELEAEDLGYGIWCVTWSKSASLFELGSLTCKARMTILTVPTSQDCCESKYSSEWERCFGKHSAHRRWWH